MSTGPEVLFVASDPIHPDYPGGFASRQHDFVATVADRHRTAVRFLAPSRRDDYETFRCDLPVTTEVIDVSSRSSPLTGVGLPRQSLARTARVDADEAELVVTLLPSVAHVVLQRGNALCVLEEGWERGIGPTSGGSPRLGWIERTRFRTLYRRIGRRRLPIVVITEREACHFGAWIAPPQVHVVPYGIDNARYSPMPGVAQDIDVLIPGALNRAEQRVEDFLFALRSNPDTKGVHCVAAGAGARQSLAAQESDLTSVTGYVPDMRPYVARSKVVVLPTFTDVGIKTTLLQAWAMARPVVTSAAVLGASPPGLGYDALTAAGSVEQMARQVGELLRIEELRREIGEAGRTFVMAHHDRERSRVAFADLVSAELERLRRDRLDGGHC